ncbi:SpoIID/LytB domain-containing protein [Deinococcus petrolearius]|uniref:SpoIID/LytB domain-containing protein n=1 Tax=Deinococcus petrolearius TaxID=1751295 RepID=A0ABW1DNC8_9DEIO
MPGLLRVSPARLLLGLSLAAAAALSTAGALHVRVLVVSAPQVTVRVASPAVDGSLGVGALPSPGPGAPRANLWRVGARGERLTLGGQDAGSATLYLPPSPGSTVEIAGKTYRGGVLLRAARGGVQAVNVVDVEDYLRGVVAAEMPASWPASALAAQAVIARTYAAARINPRATYDTCATESCQVYGGVAAEKAQTDAAIRATAGQVVSYGGKAASTYFSSDSGGYTASSAEVWGNPAPYLIAQADPFSAGGPRARWRLEIPLARVQDIAARYGVRVGALKSVAVTRQSPSGRPQEITFTGATGSAKVSGADAGGFIRSLGAGSSRAVLTGLNPLVVEGAGQGHGVGLSQYGALGLARRGYDHLHMLGFYYPGTVLSVLADSGAGQPRLAGAAPLPGLGAAARVLADLPGAAQACTLPQGGDGDLLARRVAAAPDALAWASE